MLRGEREKIDRFSSSALDLIMPNHTAYLPLIVAIILTFSHVRIWSFHA